MNANARRLVRLETHLGIGSEPVGPVIYIDPATWPAEHYRAYREAQAAGNIAAADRIIETVTGQRPTSGGSAISMIEIVRPEGEAA